MKKTVDANDIISDFQYMKKHVDKNVMSRRVHFTAIVGSKLRFGFRVV